MADDQDTEPRAVEDPLSDQDALNRLVNWYDKSTTALEDANALSVRDRDYYDGDQLTDEELEILRDRGQPPTVSNHIQPKVNFILGTEIKTRVDPHAQPVTPAHEEEAQACTDCLRSILQSCDFDSIKTKVTKNLLVEGAGAGIVEPEITTDSNGKQDIDWRVRRIAWEQFAYDARSKEEDFSDARWLAAVVWMDLDDALADPMYGKYADALKEAVEKSQPDTDIYADKPQIWAAKNPDRVRIVHMCYREKGKWAEAHFTKATWVVPPKWSHIYDDKGRTQCRIVAAASYRKQAKQDRPAECYGPVRIMVSPQDEVNKRRSKALHLLNMGQLWTENGAIEDPVGKPAQQQEIAKPDGHITVARGALVEGRIKVERNLELAQGQVQFLAEAKQELDRVGPSAPVVAGDTRVRSGRAELVQQQNSDMELAPVFESVRRWEIRIYRLLWWAARRSWTYEKWLRVRDDAEKTGLRFVPINRKITRKARFQELLSEHKIPVDKAIRMVGLQPVEADEVLAEVMGAVQAQIQQQAMAIQAQMGQVPPELQKMVPQLMQQGVIAGMMQHPRMQETFTQNDIAHLDADIVLDVAPDTAVIQNEEFEKLAELMGTGQIQFPPNVAGQLLIKASQLRNKAELLKLLETPPPDPLQQQAAQLQIELQKATVEKTAAQTEDLKAHAQQRLADAQFKTTSQAMKTEAQALEATAKAGNKSLPSAGQQGVPQ